MYVCVHVCVCDRKSGGGVYKGDVYMCVFV